MNRLLQHVHRTGALVISLAERPRIIGAVGHRQIRSILVRQYLPPYYGAPISFALWARVVHMRQHHEHPIAAIQAALLLFGLQWTGTAPSKRLSLDPAHGTIPPFWRRLSEPFRAWRGRQNNACFAGFLDRLRAGDAPRSGDARYMDEVALVCARFAIAEPMPVLFRYAVEHRRLKNLCESVVFDRHEYRHNSSMRCYQRVLELCEERLPPGTMPPYPTNFLTYTSRHVALFFEHVTQRPGSLHLDVAALHLCLLHVAGERIPEEYAVQLLSSMEHLAASYKEHQLKVCPHENNPDVARLVPLERPQFYVSMKTAKLRLAHWASTLAWTGDWRLKSGSKNRWRHLL